MEYIKKLKSLVKKSKTVEEKKPSRNPYRDWAIIFTSGVVGAFLLILGAGYVFFGVKNGDFVNTPVIPRKGIEKKFSEQDLAKTIEIFNKRTEEYEALKNEKVQIADPSL